MLLEDQFQPLWQQNFSPMDFKDLFTYGWGLVVPWIMHNHKRTQDRIDKVMDEHVKRIEFNDTINSLRSDIKEGNRGVQDRLDNLLQTLIERK